MASAETTSAGPLSGLLVCDLSTVLAGPYCTMLLARPRRGRHQGRATGRRPDPALRPALRGRPGGRRLRRWRPAADPDTSAKPGTTSRSTATSAGIRLDLRTEAGREVVRRLIAGSDVLVENFRAGGFEAMGFDDAALEIDQPAAHPPRDHRLRPDGPDADRPGFDFIIQAVSGLMSITGQPDAGGGAPTKVGVAIADVATGMLGAVSILAALLRRDRRIAGGGARPAHRPQPPRLDGRVADQPGGQLPRGRGRARAGGKPAPEHHAVRDVHLADGEIAVAVGSDRQWPRFCRALDMPELAIDPKFSSNARRVITVASCGRPCRPGSSRARPPTGPRACSRRTSRAGRSTTWPPSSPTRRRMPAAWWSRWPIRRRGSCA